MYQIAKDALTALKAVPAILLMDSKIQSKSTLGNKYITQKPFGPMSKEKKETFQKRVNWTYCLNLEQMLRKQSIV